MEEKGPSSQDVLRLQQAIVDRIARQENLSSILDDLCRLVEEILPGGFCSILRLAPEDGVLFVRAAPSLSVDLKSELDRLVPSALTSGCATAFTTGKMVIVEDAQASAQAEMRETAQRFGIRSCWSIPIRAGKSQIVGTFALSTPVPGRPTAEQILLLEVAAHLGAIAMVHSDAHAELLRQKDLFRAILDGIEDPIFVKDSKLRYMLANSAFERTPDPLPRKERIVELRPAQGAVDSHVDVIGLDDSDLYPADLAARLNKADSEILATGRSRHYEETFDNRLRDQRTFLIRKSPLKINDGKPSGIIGIARDITDLRKAEEAVRQSQKLESLGVLTGGIAHDFNNILTAILGNADFALSEPRIDPVAKSSLEVIRRAARRAAELTHQMLAYTGKSDTDKRLVYLPELLDEVIELLYSSMSKQAELTTVVDDSLPGVRADAAQIRQLMMNLVTNASEALNGSPGTVRVAMRVLELPLSNVQNLAPGRYVRLSVQDDGQGMDVETRSRIFDPFFTTKFSGRGLGLAAVQGIVRGHQGAIEVESEIGRGTTFTVLLPASRAKLARVDPAELQLDWSGCGTVLVIEDELSILSLNERILDGAGFKVLKAEDGREGLEVFEAQRHRIDLVLLDWTTSHMSGREVFLKLRELQPDVRVVLTSGYPEADTARAFEPGEIVGFLKKPYTPSKLLSSVHKALEVHV
ncbi:MAG: hypothetical protein CMJ89_04620 [Planctomycetes bacterium]|nr:hypothetical protein [Planctomycetota bacterium]